jgi:hypothetical protein
LRSKRDVSNENNFIVKNDLFVELLVVLDSTVYEFFQSVFGNFGDSIITDYIKIFFSHVVNGV